MLTSCMSRLDSYFFKTQTRPLNTVKLALTPPASGPPTDVERRVPRPGEVIDVGDAEGLDGHRADAEQQLSRRHERPQPLCVGQPPALVPAAGDLAGVALRIADVLAT